MINNKDIFSYIMEKIKNGESIIVYCENANYPNIKDKNFYKKMMNLQRLWAITKPINESQSELYHCIYDILDEYYNLLNRR